MWNSLLSSPLLWYMTRTPFWLLVIPPRLRCVRGNMRSPRFFSLISFAVVSTTFLLIFCTISSTPGQTRVGRSLHTGGDHQASVFSHINWYTCGAVTLVEGMAPWQNSPTLIPHNKWAAKEVAEGTVLLLLCVRISGAHAWRSSITPADQLLGQGGQLLMSCEKTQWNKSRYQANKLLMAVWDFYLLACSYTWQGLKGAELKEVRLWLFNYLIFMSSSVVCSHCWAGWIILCA